MCTLYNYSVGFLIWTYVQISNFFLLFAPSCFSCDVASVLWFLSMLAIDSSKNQNWREKQCLSRYAIQNEVWLDCVRHQTDTNAWHRTFMDHLISIRWQLQSQRNHILLTERFVSTSLSFNDDISWLCSCAYSLLFSSTAREMLAATAIGLSRFMWHSVYALLCSALHRSIHLSTFIGNRIGQQSYVEIVHVMWWYGFSWKRLSHPISNLLQNMGR